MGRSNWNRRKEALRKWETYAYHLTAYLFHTETGRRMRGRFFKQVCMRGFYFSLWGIGVYLILLGIGWADYHSAASVGGFLFINFDIAIGVALIRTVIDYRQRVEFYYRLDPTMNDDTDEQIPVAHRERMDPRKVKAYREAQAEAADYLAQSMSSATVEKTPEPSSLSETEAPSDTIPVIECNSCHRQIHPATAEIARRIERCMYCGGSVSRK